MARFVRSYFECEIDPFYTMVQDIFMRFDRDNSGFLDRRETARMIDEVFKIDGRSGITTKQFNQIFKEIDVNGDGVITLGEMARFVQIALTSPVDPIHEKVQQIFMKYDRDNNGFLDRRETLKMLNDLLSFQGKKPVTKKYFNAFFA